MFYKICRLENSVMRNDVIAKNNGKNRTSKKSVELLMYVTFISLNFIIIIIIIQKVLTKTSLSVIFIEFELLCQMIWAFK